MSLGVHDGKASNMMRISICWKQEKAERKAILGKKACMRKETIERKCSTRTCMEYLTMLGLGVLQYIVIVGELETYKYKYLGLIERGRG
jgi:hypothetical protein